MEKSNLVKAINKNVRSGARKANLVLNFIKGKKADLAIRDLEFTRKKIAQDIKKTINRKFEKIKINREDSKSIINLTKFDKKSKDGKVLFVLLYEIGKSKINIKVPKKTIIESLEYYKS